jgi:hypothetical protein
MAADHRRAPLPERTLLVTTGRSGSSLLAAVMAAAGADFGVPLPESWGAGSGSMEHPLAQEAGRLARQAAAVQVPRGRPSLLRYLADVRLHRAKARVRRLLAQVDTVKADNMDLWVPHVPKMGYAPRLVVPYRAPELVARSFLVQAKRNWPEVADEYARINANALLQLHTYGGCAVELDELTDPDRTAWADAVAAVAGLDRTALLTARQRLLSRSESSAGGSRDRAAEALWPPLLHAEAQAAYQALRALEGQAVPRSRAGRRRTGQS